MNNEMTEEKKEKPSGEQLGKSISNIGVFIMLGVAFVLILICLFSCVYCLT